MSPYSLTKKETLNNIAGRANFGSLDSKIQYILRSSFEFMCCGLIEEGAFLVYKPPLVLNSLCTFNHHFVSNKHDQTPLQQHVQQHVQLVWVLDLVVQNNPHKYCTNVCSQSVTQNSEVSQRTGESLYYVGDLGFIYNCYSTSPPFSLPIRYRLLTWYFRVTCPFPARKPPRSRTIERPLFLVALPFLASPTSSNPALVPYVSLYDYE